MSFSYDVKVYDDGAIRHCVARSERDNRTLLVTAFSYPSDGPEYSFEIAGPNHMFASDEIWMMLYSARKALREANDAAS